MVSHWSLSDKKSSQVSWTLFSILADLNNAVVWMVSTCPFLSTSSSPCTNHLITVPRAPITIGIIAIFMFYSISNSLGRSRYLSLFSHFKNFPQWSTGTVKSTILQVLIIRSGRLAEIWRSVCISKSQGSSCVSISRTESGPSSSIYNSVSMLIIHSAFCCHFSVPIFCSKIIIIIIINSVFHISNYWYSFTEV